MLVLTSINMDFAQLFTKQNEKITCKAFAVKSMYNKHPMKLDFGKTN